MNQIDQTDIVTESPEATLIRQNVEESAYYQKDPERFSQFLTPEALLVNVKGVRVMGRGEIVKFMKKATQSFLANVWVKNEVIQITFLRHDVAVVSGIQHVFVKGEHLSEEVAKGSLTLVLVKEEGTWLTAAGQNTLIEP
ncbi:MAG: SgcJ/EcaC family oxidoreductase [Cyclobacteriaceae bacterium]